MRVLLIDDHALFRAGLEGLLERHGIEVAGSIGDSEQALAAAVEHEADVILLDIRMPRVSGTQVLEQLRGAGIETPIVMLTTSRDEEDLVESLRSGAQGYLVKDMEPSELVAALEKIVSGETVVAPELAGILARLVKGEEAAPAPPREATLLSSLTPREFEILGHLAEGQSNKVIGRQLGISDGTVKLHVKAILRKLGIHSRVEAAVMAVEQGLGRRRPPSS
jgi:two-component system nitrate/nitrite response regulator NarL